MPGLCAKINRKKKFQGDIMETPLKRCLSTMDITLLGVGHMIGAGIYVLTGAVTHDTAGPGVILSFILAGIASLLSALCYAEFGAKVPKAGSAYVYAYVSLGEFWAFIIGWNIILEHMIGAASVARAWSGYVDSLTQNAISDYSKRLFRGSSGGSAELWAISSAPGSRGPHWPDPLAAALCVIYSVLLAMGVKFSASVNSLLTVINLGVMGLVIALGLYYANFSYWDEFHGGFLPYGFSGVLAGAATCFYAFVGFDSIATAGEEVRDPARSIPRATGYSMVIVTVGYVLVSASLTLITPYWRIDPNAALPEAFANTGLPWAKYVISVGALCGMTTTLFGSLFSLPRTMYSMASDGLLFGFLAKVSKRTQVPTINLMIGGLVSAVISFFFDLQHLVEFMSIGTFLAYTIVSASIIVLRYRPPAPPSQANDMTITSDTTTVGSASSTQQLTSPVNPDLPIDCVNSRENSMCSSMDSQLIQGFCIDRIGRVKPQFSWLSQLLATTEPGTAVVTSVAFYSVACVSLCSLLLLMAEESYEPSWRDYVILANIIVILVGSLLVICAHQQNPPGISCGSSFRVPWVPLLPAMSILLNIGLMFHLSVLTWLRFVVWMIIGLLIYFLYGMHHSKEEIDENSYAVLMESKEAEKGANWGACNTSGMGNKCDSALAIASVEDEIR